MCEYCGKVRELRPYGANGERICVECSEKDAKTTERRMREVLFKGTRAVVVLPPDEPEKSK